MALLLTLLALTRVVISTNIGTSVLLTSAADEYGAVCLDGTPGNYYFAAGEQSTKYVMFLQGINVH